ncbi:hypothetical protein GH714_026330 [Hevea brasiliensis]|uniref:Pentatricopeptide repeat-containing protein n=1 Tax=Hevea brasiliensis TaxID=3981 RepID=A0A6A6M5R7_HEVBR|nr:hypothetical protein GH714_026330 [Hevea brasiliensis]
MPDRDVVAWTTMIAGYASCNEHAYAWGMFCNMVRSEMNPDEFTHEGRIHGFFGIELKNPVSWTTLIAGYTHGGNGHHGLQVFRQMLLEEAESNPYSFSIAIRACASIGCQNYGKQIHTAVIKHGCESSLPVMNSIVDMYCRCGCLSEANQYFHEMTQKDLITWNTLIAGYEKSDSNSCKVFTELSCKNLVSWTSMMIGYGAHGYGREVIELFDDMVESGIKPDQIVFMAVLSACSHAGLVDQGLRYFNSMMDDYNIKPDHEIYGCVVDMLGRAGRVEEAYRLIQRCHSFGVHSLVLVKHIAFQIWASWQLRKYWI